MILKFHEQDHRYESDPPIKWKSASKIVEEHHEEFDKEVLALSCSQKPNSKWYGLSPEKIIQLWNDENLRSVDAGHWFHAKQEAKAIAAGSKVYKGFNLNVIPAITENGLKIAPEQFLNPGIYPEHFMYDEETGICGQSDLIYQYGDYVDIDDYKTNKEIKFNSFNHPRFGPKMMLKIMSNHEDCNFNHYCLQQSIYMKLILKKNPNLKPGRIRIYHVTFELEGKDQYGFPIYKKSPEGEFIVNGGKWYNIPYLEKEVNQIFEQSRLV